MFIGMSHYVDMLNYKAGRAPKIYHKEQTDFKAMYTYNI